MSGMAFQAGNGGRQAASHGYFAQRNARFIDPWKEAAGKIAEARLNGATGGWTPGGSHRPQLGAVSRLLLKGIVKSTIGTERVPGPARAREKQRYHTPQEYQPQYVEDQLNTERGQTQPFERPVGNSPWGNLSETQFINEHRQQFGEDPPPFA